MADCDTPGIHGYLHIDRTVLCLTYNNREKDRMAIKSTDDLFTYNTVPAQSSGPACDCMYHDGSRPQPYCEKDAEITAQNLRILAEEG